jgi:predicted CopG family antitoxin
VTATSREDNPVTVKLDRDIVARLAALKVTHGKRSYSEVIRDLLRIK